MEQTIYEMYSFESGSWVECDKQTYNKTEDKYRRVIEVDLSNSFPLSFRQPNRLDLMSNAETAITLAIGVIEQSGASQNLTNAVIKLGQARDLVYEHYRTINTLDRISEPSTKH
jgi:hypothetical protein